MCFQLAQLIVNCGGLAAVIDYLGDCRGHLRLPGIMMLGYVAAHNENLAMAVILSKVCVALISALIHINKSCDFSQRLKAEKLFQVWYVGHKMYLAMLCCVLPSPPGGASARSLPL